MLLKLREVFSLSVSMCPSKIELAYSNLVAVRTSMWKTFHLVSSPTRIWKLNSLTSVKSSVLSSWRMRTSKARALDSSASKTGRTLRKPSMSSVQSVSRVEKKMLRRSLVSMWERPRPKSSEHLNYKRVLTSSRSLCRCSILSWKMWILRRAKRSSKHFSKSSEQWLILSCVPKPSLDSSPSKTETQLEMPRSMLLRIPSTIVDSMLTSVSLVNLVALLSKSSSTRKLTRSLSKAKWRVRMAIFFLWSIPLDSYLI